MTWGMCLCTIPSKDTMSLWPNLRERERECSVSLTCTRFFTSLAGQRLVNLCYGFESSIIYASPTCTYIYTLLLFPLTFAISLRRTQFPSSSSRNAGSEPVKLNVDQSIVDRPQLYIIAIQFSEAKNRTLGVCTVRESKNPYQRVMVLPVLKLGTLALKTLSKPIAARLKKQAGLHPKFRQYIVSMAQVLSLSKILDWSST